MKEVKVKLYKFDELDNEVQQKLIEKYRNNMDIWDIDLYEEFIELRKIMEMINAYDIKYEISLYGYSYIEFKYEKYDIEYLEGIRALKYITNNIINPNMEEKIYYSKDWKKKRKSHIYYHFNDDFYLYYAIIEAYKEFKKDIKNRKQVTLADFYSMVEEKLVRYIIEQAKYYDSDEYIEECLLNQELDYTKDGRVF